MAWLARAPQLGLAARSTQHLCSATSINSLARRAISTTSCRLEERSPPQKVINSVSGRYSTAKVNSSMARKVQATWNNAMERAFPISNKRGTNFATDQTIDLNAYRNKPLRIEYPYQWVMWLLIGSNVVVCLIWTEAERIAEKYKDPTLSNSMRNIFSLTKGDLNEGRWWKFLSSSFSNQSPMRTLVDSVFLYGAAPAVMAVIGPTAFVALYVCSGAITRLVTILWCPTLPFNFNKAGDNNIGAGGSTIAFLTLLQFLQRPHSIWFYVAVPIIDTLYNSIDPYNDKNGNGRNPLHCIPAVLLAAFTWRFGLKKARYTHFTSDPKIINCRPTRLDVRDRSI